MLPKIELTETQEELDQIDVLLANARKHGLEWEVINSAIQYLRESRDQSVSAAFEYGYNEWIK